jgi:hypothetical protein
MRLASAWVVGVPPDLLPPLDFLLIVTPFLASTGVAESHTSFHPGTRRRERNGVRLGFLFGLERGVVAKQILPERQKKSQLSLLECSSTLTLYQERLFKGEARRQSK